MFDIINSDTYFFTKPDQANKDLTLREVLEYVESKEMDDIKQNGAYPCVGYYFVVEPILKGEMAIDLVYNRDTLELECVILDRGNSPVIASPNLMKPILAKQNIPFDLNKEAEEKEVGFFIFKRKETTPFRDFLNKYGKHWKTFILSGVIYPENAEEYDREEFKNAQDYDALKYGSFHIKFDAIRGHGVKEMASGKPHSIIDLDYILIADRFFNFLENGDNIMLYQTFLWDVTYTDRQQILAKYTDNKAIMKSRLQEDLNIAGEVVGLRILSPFGFSDASPTSYDLITKRLTEYYLE